MTHIIRFTFVVKPRIINIHAHLGGFLFSGRKFGSDIICTSCGRFLLDMSGTCKAQIRFSGED